jgi:hypothetical protein
MRIRPVLALAAMLSLTACDGLRDALTAHTDVAARTASQELPVTRLATLMGDAQVPIEITRENVELLATLWADYQRLGYAAARGDTLLGKMDAVVQPIVDNMRVGMMIDSLRARTTAPAATETGYNDAAGGLYAARHILFQFPPSPTPQQRDSVRRRVEGIRAQLTPANFATMAQRYGSDGSAAQGGALGIFRKADMVPEFSNATAALKVGEISAPVESQFGLHLIYRQPYGEIAEEYAQAFEQISMQATDSVLTETLANDVKLQLKDNASTTAKAAVRDMAKHRKDNTVIATYDGRGSFTVAELLRWLDVLPPQFRQQVMQGLPEAPDSVVNPFVRQMALREVVIRMADSAKVDVPADQKDAIAAQFTQLVTQVWAQLGVSPEMLADSAKSGAERERMAAARVEAFVDRLLAGEVSPVGIPVPLKSALDAQYEVKLSSAGMDRAFEQAQKARAAADSARMAGQPQSQVPMPMLPPGVTPPPGTRP